MCVQVIRVRIILPIQISYRISPAHNSIDKMAAPDRSKDTGGANFQGKFNEQMIPKNLSEQHVANFNVVIDHIIGNKKSPRTEPLVIGGVPQMPMSREEIFIKGVFDSCAFKSAASCVVGTF